MPSHADIRNALAISSRDELLKLVDLWGWGHRPLAEKLDDAGIRQRLLAFWDSPDSSEPLKRQMTDQLQLD